MPMKRLGRSTASARALTDSDDVFVAMIESGHCKADLAQNAGLETGVLGHRLDDEIRH
jgi:hypothetical protein